MYYNSISYIFRKSRSPTSKGRTVAINSSINHRSPSISPSRSPGRRSYGGSSDDQVNNNAAPGTHILWLLLVFIFSINLSYMFM